MRRLLYIEDDEIDVLTLKRILKKHPDIDLEVVANLASLKTKTLSDYSAVICDANLPDAHYIGLKEYLTHVDQLLFVSGSQIEGEEVCMKPIKESDVLDLLNSFGVKLDYIKTLADNDADFEKEMIETALEVLPSRKEGICAATTIEELRNAAHKAKSSFRVCGMNPQYLTVLEGLDASEFKSELHVSTTEIIVKQIEDAIEFLNKY